ncbi:MAG TPA: hypothetical protein PK339_02240 [Flavitalea sp.]|nr:hypothetical protein [Flavitalea sp.]
MDQKDREILSLIRHTKLKLDSEDFEQRCMHLIDKEAQLDRRPSIYYKISGWCYLAGLAVCVAIILLSLTEKPDELMRQTVLQSFVIGAACYLVIQVKTHLHHLR